MRGLSTNVSVMTVGPEMGNCYLYLRAQQPRSPLSASSFENL